MAPFWGLGWGFARPPPPPPGGGGGGRGGLWGRCRPVLAPMGIPAMGLRRNCCLRLLGVGLALLALFSDRRVAVDVGSVLSSRQ